LWHKGKAKLGFFTRFLWFCQKILERFLRRLAKADSRAKRARARSLPSQNPGNQRVPQPHTAPPAKGIFGPWRNKITAYLLKKYPRDMKLRPLKSEVPTALFLAGTKNRPAKGSHWQNGKRGK
jgi:hypothetical protein